MGIAEILGIIAGSSGLGAAVTHFLSRKNADRAMKVSEFKVITDEWNELHGALKERLDALERSLITEREEHSATRRLLTVALRHIRDIVAWGAGDRRGPMPEPPAELMRQI